MPKYKLRWDDTGQVIFWDALEPWGYDDAIQCAKDMLEMAHGREKPWGFMIENFGDAGFTEWGRMIETMDAVTGLLQSDPNYGRVIGHVSVVEELAVLAIEVYEPMYKINAIAGLDREQVYEDMLKSLASVDAHS